MTRASLYVGVVALIILSTSVSASAVSLGKLPITLGEESGRSSAPESAAVSEEGEQEFDISQPLALEECIRIALQSASEMKTGKLDLILEEMNVKDARSSYLPQINAAGGYQFSDDADFGWEKENYDASVSARYTIWDHGQRQGQTAQAKARRTVQYSRYNQTGQSLIFSVVNAYYSILEAEKLIAVDEELLEQSKGNVEKIKALVEVGEVIESDISTARVQQANAELSIIQGSNTLELARANLAVIMGLSPDVNLSVLDAPDYGRYMQMGVIEAEEISTEEAISQALENRPEMVQLISNMTVLEWALTLAKLETFPKITADCGYNVWLDDYLRERDALKNHKSWDVSTRVSYTIFDGGKSGRTVERAEIALLKLQESKTELERSISLEVYQAYLNLEKARKSLEIANVQVEDAKMSLDVIQGRYDQQMIILLELLDAQARYNQSLTNQVKAFYDYKIAKSTLEKAMGVLQ